MGCHHQKVRDCWPKGTIALYFDDSKTHVVCCTNLLSVFSTQISIVEFFSFRKEIHVTRLKLKEDTYKDIHSKFLKIKSTLVFV